MDPSSAEGQAKERCSSDPRIYRNECILHMQKPVEGKLWNSIPNHSANGPEDIVTTQEPGPATAGEYLLYHEEEWAFLIQEHTILGASLDPEHGK